MPYSNNIPQPNDRLRNSQNDLLNNFQAIGTGFAFNHVDLNLADAGKHNLLTMPRQAFPQPAVNNLGTDLLMYVGENATTTLSELYLKRLSDAANPGIPFTAKVVTVGGLAGWSYIPSGMLIQWGNVAGVAGAASTITLPKAYTANNTFTIMLTLDPNGNPNSFTHSTVTRTDTTHFSVFVTGGPGNCVVNYFTIGL